MPPTVCADPTALAAIGPDEELGSHMRANQIMDNLRVADLEAAKTFYTDHLG